MDILAKDLNNNLVSLDKSAIEALQSEIRGKVLLPDDTGFDQSRTLWNDMVNK